MTHARINAIFNSIQTPAYVADEARLRRNLAVLKDVKDRTSVHIIYAIKACPLYPIFSILAETLDGSTASGYFEAKLGHEHFGKEVHVFNPAYTPRDVDDLLSLNTPVHFYFNSVVQLEQFEAKIRAASPDHQIGIRTNPRLSVTKYEKYNPCRRGSHLGVPLEKLDTVPWDKVDIFHAHALCENMAEQSAQLIQQIADKAAPYIAHVKCVNFGGGHFITDPDYNADVLVEALNTFQKQFPHVQTILEPGAASVRDGGYIVASVIAVVETDGVQTAIIDASANCHVPDVIKASVRLDILGSGETGEKPHNYTIAARTCMARDVWGEYSFDAPLKAGDKIVFTDGLQYSMGEANWFNGHPRPDLGIIQADGTYKVLHRFGYEDFKFNCG